MVRLLLILTIGVMGCRPIPERGTLRGTVTRGGVPLTAGSVMLQADRPRWATVAILGPSGEFVVTDVPPGPVRIGIRTRGVKRFDGGPEPTRVPRRFEDPASSGLLVEVVPGEQDFTVELPVEGAVP